ncbi:hypothetical protein Amir_6116 [Actinosynnema mirum DSM 43827]|uniref:DUF3558 domain-containing protein n=1 Tax=Actinosynnema mirum (strain ATCC 29888 / DSM 43827 / JCM 3225 / NBRC 14064 / NCIMB 13271 / NRRL B-12336 / IMRU 3971 / 101) TaxID=446462 RepID=C6WHH4_ACTMD|nr:hypothetical protein Amir_6116 [Actinosynnema mirum DSM 43827]
MPPRRTRTVATVQFVHRSAAVLCALLLVVAGCSGTDLAKHSPYPRETLDAGAANSADENGGSTDEGAPPGSVGTPVSAEFSGEKLRATDVCKLVDETVLRKHGTPAELTGNNFGECSNYMKDKAGKSLSVTLAFRSSSALYAKSDKRIEGLKLGENVLEGQACFVSGVFQDEPPMDLTAQISYKSENNCEIGRELLTAAIKRVKAGSALRTNPKGSLASVDPCRAPDPAVVEAAINASGSNVLEIPLGLPTCSWSSRERSLMLAFQQVAVSPRKLPGDKTVDVDLGGGVTGRKLDETGSAFPSCKVEWTHRDLGAGGAEVARLTTSGAKDVQFDRCETVATVAKALVAKLPRG